MNAEFMEALNAIEKERGISKDILIDAFESALIAAYKRNYGTTGNVRAVVDRDTGEVQIFASKTVVEQVENIRTHGQAGCGAAHPRSGTRRDFR